jgi:hypothetical protein
MQNTSFPRQFYKVFVIAFLLIFAGVACVPVAPGATPASTIYVLREVVTHEVTRIVYVPVTITPTPTIYTTDTVTRTPTVTVTPLTPTVTSTPPTVTPTPQPPAVSVLVHTECYFGPDLAYIGMYEILADSPQVGIGRNQDTSWMLLQGADHKNPCWVKTALLKTINGNFIDAPVSLPPVLTPYTKLYAPPPAASAGRQGNTVTIFWLPVAMTEADYGGYLVEAWVCQGGTLEFEAKGYVTAFNKNSSMMAVSFTDEAGCSKPSSARVFTVMTGAYSRPINVVPWPVATSPTPTPTP